LPGVLLDLKSSILREVAACPRGPKAVLFRLAKFFLENLVLNAKKKRRENIGYIYIYMK
jgi:hypothetical protein